MMKDRSSSATNNTAASCQDTLSHVTLTLNNNNKINGMSELYDDDDDDDDDK